MFYKGCGGDPPRTSLHESRTMNTSSAPTHAVDQPARPSPFLVPPRSPRPGDDLEFTWLWLRWKTATTGKVEPDAYTTRQYARALYENLADPKPKRNDDPAGEAAWYGRLSEGQRILLEKAREARQLDPKVKAERKAELKRSAEHQGKLLKARLDYKLQVEAEQDREVRIYVKGKTKAEIRNDRKARNEKLRNKINARLQNGANPFRAIEYPNTNTCIRISRERTKHLACEELLKDGSIDLHCAETRSRFLKFVDVEPDDIDDLIAGAVEALRVAKAIRMQDGKVFLHKSIEDALARSSSSLRGA